MDNRKEVYKVYYDDGKYWMQNYAFERKEIDLDTFEKYKSKSTYDRVVKKIGTLTGYIIKEREYYFHSKICLEVLA